jgi:hypothetical protein
MSKLHFFELNPVYRSPSPGRSDFGKAHFRPGGGSGAW